MNAFVLKGYQAPLLYKTSNERCLAPNDIIEREMKYFRNKKTREELDLR